MSNATRKMEARYAGKCICGERIAKGSWIAWAKGEKARHWDCRDKEAVPARDARGSRREAARGVAELLPGEAEAMVQARHNSRHGLCPDGCCGRFEPCGDTDCCA